MTRKLAQAILVGLLLAAAALAQTKQVQRRPPASPDAPLPLVQPRPAYDYFSILDGTPRVLVLHHDTEVGTNKPIDVYMFAIELQVMNSDGNLEPEGLIIDNFYTAKAIHPNNAPNPHNARDCKIWNNLVLNEIAKPHERSYLALCRVYGGERRPRDPNQRRRSSVVERRCRMLGIERPL